MTGKIFRLSIYACLIFCLQAQNPGANTDRLPIRRVVLYKNGVGYFEHVGTVRGNDDVSVSFTSGQLNDVLKSLTVLDLNGGRISGVAYGSTAPADRQLDDLRLPTGEKNSLTEILSALRGARLEIRSGTNVITGRLLSIERKTRISGGTTLEVDYLSLLSDGGELRTTELSPSFSVRLLDRGLPGKVERYLDIVSSARQSEARRMVISTAGSGDRSLFVSYISEVPVWKTTYRVVLGSKAGQGPLLQGWAIVDNTSAEDWSNVQLSLVAGAPQSFIQNLSQPYYSRRPTVPLPQNVMISPQTYEAPLIAGGARIAGSVRDPSGAAVPRAGVKVFDADGTLVGQATADADGNYEVAGLPEGAMRVEISFPGFSLMRIGGLVASAAAPARADAVLQVGSVSQAVEVTASAPSVQTSTASLGSVNVGGGRSLGSGAALGGVRALNKSAPPPPPPASGPAADSPAMARARAEAAAMAQELGDLFEYKLKEPVTIAKNRSVLVPVVQSSIGAEKVSVWNDRAGFSRPQRALWIVNSSGLTLDGGSFSVLEDETFAGEGVVEPIRPGEKRLVSYATDLGVNASSRDSIDQQRFARVRVLRGVMIQEAEVREKKTYTFRNEDTTSRTIIVEHPVRPGYELRSQPEPIETSAGWMRFRLHLDPKQTASLVVQESRPLQTTYQISNLNSEQLALFVRQKSIDETVESALHKVLAQKAVVADLESRKEDADDEATKIFDDQQRLRENMKALKATAEEKALLQRYVQQLNRQEDRLEALKKDAADLDRQLDDARSALNRLIESLSFEVKL
jgi:hypothetical protein